MGLHLNYACLFLFPLIHTKAHRHPQALGSNRMSPRQFRVSFRPLYDSWDSLP